MVSKSKRKKKTYKSIKRELLSLLKENGDVEEQGHSETVSRSNSPKTQNRKAIRYISKQGELLTKFKDT